MDFIIIKKIFIGIFLLVTLSGCVQNVALLGPSYTMATTGNIYQAGLTYSSQKAVNQLTGKSTGENIKEILTPKENNTDLRKLVKKNIEETRKKLKISNQ